MLGGRTKACEGLAQDHMCSWKFPSREVGAKCSRQEDGPGVLWVGAALGPLLVLPEAPLLGLHVTPAGLAWDSSLIFRSQQGTRGPKELETSLPVFRKAHGRLESFLICKTKIAEASFLGGFEDSGRTQGRATWCLLLAVVGVSPSWVGRWLSLRLL